MLNLFGLMDAMLLGQHAWFWAIFFVVIAVLLAVDLGALHRGNREIGLKESLWLSLGYITAACLFGVWVWSELGYTSGVEYFTGYVVEKSLSMDNLLVMSVIFTYFSVPKRYQHRVLFWGILGAVIMRGLMIGFGIALISEMGWILYIFGAFLVYTGIKIFRDTGDEDPDLGNNPVLKFLSRHLRMTDRIENERFFMHQAHPKTGKMVRYATPLFLCLIMIEITDIVFAVDSIPAIFAITLDPYIVFTSNIFAILGLRALYFAMAAVLHRFSLMKKFLAVILVMIGGKIYYEHFVGDIEPMVSLTLTLGILIFGMIYSWRKSAYDEKRK